MSSEDTNTVLTSTNINVFESLGYKANYFENLYSQAVSTGFAGTRLEFLNELGLLTDSGELLPFPNANENVNWQQLPMIQLLQRVAGLSQVVSLPLRQRPTLVQDKLCSWRP